MTADEIAIFDKKIDKFGFAKVHFEGLSLVEQAGLLKNADVIMAPHGAGLGNIMFGHDDLAVRELTRDIDGKGALRAGFYRAASIRHLPYAFLNQSAGDFADENIDAFFSMSCK